MAPFGLPSSTLNGIVSHLNWFLDSLAFSSLELVSRCNPTPHPFSFIFLLLNHQGLLAWTVCMNEPSLLEEGQEAGPVFIPSNPLQSCQERAHRASPHIWTGQAK